MFIFPNSKLGVLLSGTLKCLDSALRCSKISINTNTINNDHHVELFQNMNEEASLNVNHIVLDSDGKLIKDKLYCARDEIFESEMCSFIETRCNELLQCETLVDENET